MTALAIIGCGFVADLYMASLAKHANLSVVRVFDRDPARLSAFAAHWRLDKADTLDGLLAGLPKGCIILNLTNPHAHYEVSKACLAAGFHVYSEKPLAMDLDQARDLHALAARQGVLLASAPCSVLGEAAQVLAGAVRDGVAGRPRLVYAELDDGFIPQAPYEDWRSASGAPWPYGDEFRVGCTLEHAGYYLTWLVAMFGPVVRVVAASAELVEAKPGGGGASDFSVAVLFFADGVVARLTCSIIAPHDHRIRVIGDKGVLAVRRAWDNAAKVRFHRRLRLRRRLIDLPVGRRIRPRGATHPKVARTGAAAMNFALGPAEMAASLAEGRPCRLSADFALHLTEVTLAIQNSGDHSDAQVMTTSCEKPEAMSWLA
ncbi:MAG: Gfo/Idh/MocA family oxidoreductase [Rhodobacteraceae bacterium]|nr:Gfo/Idh/MocA family oxidoreductase [Paracoccaceae bacterium]